MLVHLKMIILRNSPILSSKGTYQEAPFHLENKLYEAYLEFGQYDLNCQEMDAIQQVMGLLYPSSSKTCGVVA